MTRHELTDYCLRLEQIVDRKDGNKSNKVIDIMKVLASLNIDPLLLRNANIVFTVNDLRKKLDDREVARLTKELLSTWKNQVVAEMNEIRHLLINGKEAQTKTISRQVKYINEYKRRLSEDTNEENRIKSREMIAKALMADRVINDDILKIADIAVGIERAIFVECKKLSTDRKYLTRVRSRVANLGDEDRTDLRAQVIKGTITPEEMASMSAADMASDRLKKLRERFTEETMKENILPEVYGTTTDLLRCPECKENTCAYNQVQIDRADEPMTTFCLCITCGHRWRFN